MGAREEQRCHRNIEDDNHERNTNAAQHLESLWGEPVRERAGNADHRNRGVAVDTYKESERFRRHTSLHKHIR